MRYLALARADPADAAEAARRVSERALLNDQPAFAVRVFDEARRPIAVFRVGVLLPQLERLQDVTVGVNDVVSAAHATPPKRRL